ncbi:MAG: DUF3035 domain-containing protein [Alphaproteobacteria bacterium]|jgi:hypothetical protein|nr:DUF3035 domain-containing protein [Alphaproteobacteria bacterium]MDP6517093.1 DUF3035 domain-containing protein [Alphaproteobacteria bacterium]|tara:strand:- start:258 stop:812 length:555 start_codon:yes stop_codon:yes gene_type:complete
MTGWRERAIGCLERGAAVALLGAGLGACDTTALKKELGFGKQSPDEYNVVEHAPLSLPPDFHLRPPAPGQPRPQEVDLRRQAQRILMGLRSGGKVERSAGETALLDKAGALDVDPDIRQQINRENGIYAVEDERFVDDLMFWEGQSKDEAEIVDPVAEAERLRENAAAGLPPTHGETPTIQRKQ